MNKLSTYLLIAFLCPICHATTKQAVQSATLGSVSTFSLSGDTSTISLEERAEQGDVDAMYELSLQSLDASLVEPNKAFDTEFAYTAFYWANEAHKKGNLNATARLGLFYEKALATDKDLNKALELYNQSAEQGNAFALAYLALFYQNSDIDKAKATLAKLLKIVDEQEGLDGEIYLFAAQSYLNGELCEKDTKKAVDILLKLQNLNEGKKGYNNFLNTINNAVVFCYLKAIGVEKDEAKALEIYKKTIAIHHSTNINFLAYELGLLELDKAESYYNLARAYLFSENKGILKTLYKGNEEKAKHFYQKTIDMGYNLGYYGLGKIEEEKGNLESAFEFYKKACTPLFKNPNWQENEAMIDLAKAYQNGIGTKKDQAKAIELYEQAIAFNNARSALGFIYYENQDYKKALKYLLKASVLSLSPKIHSTIASCYENGLGTETDTEKAIEYYKKAARYSDMEEKLELNENAKYLSCSIGVPFDLFYESEPIDKKAMSGDVNAMYDLAESHLEFQGIGSASHKNKFSAYSGFYWYKKAYENGSIKAIDKLGRCYEWGIGTNRDYEKAVEIYKVGWQKGNAFALLRLFNTITPLFTHGRIPNIEEQPEYLALLEMARTKDDLEPEIYEAVTNIALLKKDKEAISFLEKTIKNANSFDTRNNAVQNAYIALAYCYATGNLVEKNEAKAVELINALDEFTEARLFSMYPYLFIKDILGLNELKTAEDFYAIAFIYDPNSTSFILERNLITQDIEKAILYYQKSAALGSMKAKYELVKNWKKGDDSQKKKAFDLVLDSLNLADTKKVPVYYKREYAEYLADCYSEGKIVEKDITKAIEYYKQAIEADNTSFTPKLRLAEIYFKGEDVEQDYTKAYSYLKQLEDKFVPSVAYEMLAKCYLNGLGGAKKDLSKAKEYYKKLFKSTPSKNKEKRQEIQSIIDKLDSL